MSAIRRLEHILLAAAAGTLLLVSAPATAQPRDGVAILPAGGITEADVYSLTGSPGKGSAERTDRRTLVDGDLAPSAFTSLAIARDGSNILARVGGRGVVVTDDSGRLEFALGPEGERRGVASAVVAGYDDGMEPRRLLYGNERRRRLRLWDRRLERLVWSLPLAKPTTKTDIVQVAALPDQRVAVAMNWPDLQTSAVDIYDLTAESPEEVEKRFASDTHPGAPGDLVTAPELSNVRDLYGIGPDGETLLVTTADEIVTIELGEDRVRERLALNDRDAFAGMFMSARRLPSGRTAVATVQPGVWQSRHPNHRVFWLEPSFGSIVTKTPILGGAPWKLERPEGHGGSGTAAFAPPLDWLPSAPATDVELTGQPLLRPNPVQQGTASRLTFEIRNPTTTPAVFEEIRARARPGGCEADSGWRQLDRVRQLVVARGQTRTFRRSFRISEEAPTGEWCLQIRVTDRDGNRAGLEPTLAFDVQRSATDAGPGSGRRIRPIDLGLRYGDASGDGSDTGPPDIFDPPDGDGCGCGASGRPTPWGLPMLAAALVGLRFVRRD